MTITIEKTAYTIKEFSSIINLSPFTIRYHEKEGLFSPRRQITANKPRRHRRCSALRR